MKYTRVLFLFFQATKPETKETKIFSLTSRVIICIFRWKIQKERNVSPRATSIKLILRQLPKTPTREKEYLTKKKKKKNEKEKEVEEVDETTDRSCIFFDVQIFVVYQQFVCEECVYQFISYSLKADVIQFSLFNIQFPPFIQAFGIRQLREETLQSADVDIRTFSLLCFSIIFLY